MFLLVELDKKTFQIGAFGQVGMYRMIGPDTPRKEDAAAAAGIREAAAYLFRETGDIHMMRA